MHTQSQCAAVSVPRYADPQLGNLGTCVPKCAKGECGVMDGGFPGLEVAKDRSKGPLGTDAVALSGKVPENPFDPHLGT